MHEIIKYVKDRDLDGMFIHSLRSVVDFDVSVIEEKYGGGGHKNAAGFTYDKLEFNIVKGG